MTVFHEGGAQHGYHRGPALRGEDHVGSSVDGALTGTGSSGELASADQSSLRVRNPVESGAVNDT